MKDYKIVHFANHQITLSFDENKVSFPLPIVDGLYPEGAALDELLDIYVANARQARLDNAQIVANEAIISNLVVQPTLIEQSVIIRFARNRLLNATDWTRISDVGLSSEESGLWLQYRANLRDIPNQPNFPSQVIWPIPPSTIKNSIGVAMTNVDGSPKTMPAYL